MADAGAGWKLYPQSWYDVQWENESVEVWPAGSDEERSAAYWQEGMRTTVVFVLMTHRYLMPHVLFLTLDDYVGLPAVRVHDDLVKEVNEYLARFFTNDGIRLGSLLGTAWVTASAATHHDPVPVLPAHCTRPKEKLLFYQVDLPHLGSFNLTGEYRLKAIPLTDLNEGWFAHLPFMLSRFQFECFGDGRP